MNTQPSSQKNSDTDFSGAGEEVLGESKEELKSPPFTEKEGPEAFEQVIREFPRLIEYCVSYVFVQWDLLEMRSKNALRTLGFIFLVAIIAIGGAVSGVVFILLGLAQGIEAWWGMGPWVGHLIVGALFLVLLFSLLGFKRVQWRGRNLKKRMRQYGTTP